MQPVQFFCMSQRTTRGAELYTVAAAVVDRCQVAIFDATNSTNDRRQKLVSGGL